MKNPLHGLKTLVRVKKRRLEQLDQAIKEQMQAIAACDAQLQQAQQSEAQCRSREAACREKIQSKLSAVQGFRPIEIVTLRHVLDGLVDQTRQAAKAVHEAQQAKDSAEETLRETRRMQQRVSQQIDQLQERLRKLQQEIELAAEDVQDEESEEAAVARMLAAREPAGDECHA